MSAASAAAAAAARPLARHACHCTRRALSGSAAGEGGSGKGTPSSTLDRLKPVGGSPMGTATAPSPPPPGGTAKAAPPASTKGPVSIAPAHRGAAAGGASSSSGVKAPTKIAASKSSGGAPPPARSSLLPRLGLLAAVAVGGYGGAVALAVENKAFRQQFEAHAPFAGPVLAFFSQVKAPAPVVERDLSDLLPEERKGAPPSPARPAEPEAAAVEAGEDGTPEQPVAEITIMQLQDGVLTEVPPAAVGPDDGAETAGTGSPSAEDVGSEPTAEAAVGDAPPPPPPPAIDPAAAALDQKLDLMLAEAAAPETTEAAGGEARPPTSEEAGVEAAPLTSEEARSAEPAMQGPESGDATGDDAATEETDAVTTQHAGDEALAQATLEKSRAEALGVAEVTAAELDAPTDTSHLSEPELEARDSRRRIAVLEAQLQELLAAGKASTTEALSNQREQLQAEHDAAFQSRREEHLAHLQRECTEIHRQLTEQFEAEAASLKEEHALDLQEHLRVQHKAHEALLSKQLSAQAKDIWQKSETEISLRLGRERAQRIVNLERLFLRLRAAEAVLANHKAAEAAMLESHAVFMAADSLSQAVARQEPLSTQLRALLEAGENNEVVRAVLATLPAHAQRGRGVPTRRELHARFRTVREAIRQVALVGDRDGVFAYAVSHVLSFLRVRRHGLVPGTGVEAVLARAEYHLLSDDIDKAAREVNQLQGAARRAAQSWLADARLLLEVEQAITVIRAHVTLEGLSTL